MTPNLITFSFPTYGPSGFEVSAATYSFYSSDYQPPRRKRATSSDTVVNQNGTFKYVYDNGPAGYIWSPFRLALDDNFEAFCGGRATQQLANLDALWNHQGQKGMSTPDGIYEITWSNDDLELQLVQFPRAAGDKMEYRATIGIEEA